MGCFHCDASVMEWYCDLCRDNVHCESEFVVGMVVKDLVGSDMSV